MKKALLIGLLIMVLMALAGCAAGPNAFLDTPDDDGDVAGFWRGLWHGIITPITFIISLFSDNVSIYEVHNTGGWYDFGYLLGLITIWGGGGGGAASARKRGK